MRKVIAGWHRILHNISYIHKIMISYLVFIALSIVMQSFLCFYMYHQIKNEIIISNTFKMEDTKKNFDSIFSNIEFIYQSLAQNPDLNELKSMLPRGTDYYLKINDFLKNPMLRQGINERNYNYYLYIKNGDMIISKNAAADRIDFYEQSIDTKRMSLGEWSAYFNGTGRRFARIPMIDNGAATQMMLSFLYPIPYSRVTEADITLVVTVDEGVFIDSYNRMGLNGYSSFSIVDHNGEMVMSTAEPEKEFLSVSGGMSFSGDSVIFNARSDIGNYNYIIEIENTVFWERLRPILIFMAIGIAAYLTIGGVMMRFLVRRNYRPVGELLSLFNFDNKMNRCKTDEFAMITDEIIKNVSQYNSLKEQLYKQEAVHLPIVLAELFSGRYNQETFRELFPKVYQDFETNDYVLLIIKDVAPASGMEAAMDSRQIIIRDVLTELLDQERKVYAAEVDGAIVFATMVESEGYKEKINQAVRHAQEFLTEGFDIEFTASVSAVHSGVAEIREAYTEALFVFGFRFMLDHSGVEHYDMIDETKLSITYQYPSEIENRMTKAIKDGNYELAESIAGQLFELNIRGNKMNARAAHILAMDLLGTCLKSLYSFENVPESITKKIYATRMLMSEFDTERMKSSVCEILRLICETADGEGGKKNILELSLQIVEEQYTNPDINNDYIAQRLSVNPQYLSRTIRSHFGRGLPEIITEKRMAEAKKLLRTGMKIDDIAAAVGFSSTRNFRRTFVKYTGSAPVEYRNKNI